MSNQVEPYVTLGKIEGILDSLEMNLLTERQALDKIASAVRGHNELQEAELERLRVKTVEGEAKMNGKIKLGLWAAFSPYKPVPYPVMGQHPQMNGKIKCHFCQGRGEREGDPPYGDETPGPWWETCDACEGTGYFLPCNDCGLEPVGYNSGLLCENCWEKHQIVSLDEKENS